METAINLQDLLTTIRKRWFLILSLAVFTSATAAVFSYYVLTPIYQAETQLLVNQKSTNIEQYQWLQNNEADLRLINTYNEIITSPIIISKVIEKLELDQTPDSLAEQITVTSANNSQVVNLVVIDKEASMAVKISNTLAEVFQKEMPPLMNVDNIKILSEAKLVENPTPVKPNKLLNITSAAIIGLMLGVVLAFLLEFFDRRFKSEQEVEEILGLPIIGLVGAINLEKDTKKSLKSRRVKRG